MDKTTKQRAMEAIRDSPEGLSTQGVARALSLRPGGVRNRLFMLLHEGKVDVRDGVVGGSSARVWTLTDSGLAEVGAAPPMEGQMTISDEDGRASAA